MLAGELQKSSFTSSKYMAEAWPKLAQTGPNWPKLAQTGPNWPKLAEANLNTVLGSVTWEQIEPEEDNFDFAGLDECLRGARQSGLRLVVLWFGSFKNGGWWD
jgi:beta-galactosidase GanA